ncbi:low choriolytic enzyme-like [Phycodurus eques]|uniref:low choriolytic enzyme-like n=1 Tax=Phycodurus eques TaxID=693459 RepID=UPI002ACD3256|nr:low choriolytic enzyme-like [Phycodurus eques]
MLSGGKAKDQLLQEGATISQTCEDATDLRAIMFLLLLQLVTLCHARPGWDQAVDSENSRDPAEENISETILRMNNGSTEYLIEGDVVIPKTRTAMKCTGNAYSCLWPKSHNGKVEIPYSIIDKYTNSEKRTIVGALRAMEARTCIRFIPRTTQRSYLSFEPKFGCFSMLGRTGEKQLVSLQRFGCVQHGIIQHEVLHAMGFYHEHTRSDRDRYIRINWENIQDYNKYNFEKHDTDNLNIPYDYSSILHYGRTAFGVRQAVTLTPIPDSSVEIGQREDLSDMDILRINRLYKCSN